MCDTLGGWVLLCHVRPLILEQICLFCYCQKWKSFADYLTVWNKLQVLVKRNITGREPHFTLSLFFPLNSPPKEDQKNIVLSSDGFMRLGLAKGKTEGTTFFCKRSSQMAACGGNYVIRDLINLWVCCISFSGREWLPWQPHHKCWRLMLGNYDFQIGTTQTHTYDLYCNAENDMTVWELLKKNNPERIWSKLYFNSCLVQHSYFDDEWIFEYF